jgi:hypothetical protein
VRIIKLTIKTQKKNFIGGRNLHPFIQTQELLAPKEIILKNKGNSNNTQRELKSPYTPPIFLLFARSTA